MQLTIYVYDNASGKLIDEFTGENNIDCEAWYLCKYDINDFHACYTDTREV